MCSKEFGAFMVSIINNLGVTNNIPNKTASNDVKTLIKYVNNEALKETPDTFTSTTKSALGSAAVFEGIPFFNFIRRNAAMNKFAKASGKNFVTKDLMNNLGQINKEALQNLLHGKENIGKRILSYLNTTKGTTQAYRDVRGALSAQLKEAKAVSKGSKNITKYTAKSAEKLKTAQEAVKKIGTKTTAEAGAKTVSKLGKIGNLFKSSGAGIMLVFSGIIEGVSEVVPTFQELGFEKGMKQLGKSTVKVLGDTAGFIAGEYAGTAIGSAIGTAIFPGVGTAVGAVCGFVGGMLGSFLTGKVTKAITGKSEREKVKEEELNKQIQDISNNDEALEELKNTAKLKIQEEAQAGVLSEDSKVAMDVLNNLDNPFVSSVA